MNNGPVADPKYPKGTEVIVGQIPGSVISPTWNTKKRGRVLVVRFNNRDEAAQRFGSIEPEVRERDCHLPRRKREESVR